MTTIPAVPRRWGFHPAPLQLSWDFWMIFFLCSRHQTAEKPSLFLLWSLFHSVDRGDVKNTVNHRLEPEVSLLQTAAKMQNIVIMWLLGSHVLATNHFLGHHIEKLREVDCSRSFFINVCNHFLDFFFLRFEPQSSHGNLRRNKRGQAELSIWSDRICTKITELTFSSFTSIVPVPSESKRSNASLISCFCSSVSSVLWPVFFLWLVEGTALREPEACRNKIKFAGILQRNFEAFLRWTQRCYHAN